MTGFQNEGDNEITGFHISDGDASVKGLIGTQTPTPFKHGWRVFYTQQHGDNNTWEILPAGGKGVIGKLARPQTTRGRTAPHFFIGRIIACAAVSP